LAQTGGVVALSAAAALVTVVVGHSGLGEIGASLGHAGLQVQAVDPGCAAGAALIRLDGEQVLLALDGIASESDLDINNSGTDPLAGHLDSIDDFVGQVQQSKVDIVNKICHVPIIEHNGDSGKSLIESGGEGQSEGSEVEVAHVHHAGDESQGLHLVLGGHQQVVANRKNIVSVRAHSLGAVNIAVGGIAQAAAGLAGVPVVVVEGNFATCEVHQLGRIPLSRVGEIIHILAGSVARAIIGASGSLARFAFKPVEARALASASVAYTSSGALGIFMESSQRIGSINPCELKRTNSIRAVSTVVTQTDTPIVVTLAYLIDHAGTVATAVIIAIGVQRSGKCQEKSQS
jgi:hypothetical protein